MAEIKVVLFDIGNVLMLADHRRTIEKFVYYGVPRELVETYFDRPDYRKVAQGIITWNQFEDRLREEWSSKTFNLYHNIYLIHSKHIYAIDSEVRDLINDISETGIKIAFITDTCYCEHMRYQYLQPSFRKPFAPAIWCSYEEKCLKADPGTFLDIVNRWIPEKLKIEVLPHEVFFVDDSVVNCQAAKDIGIQVFQYTKFQPWLLRNELRARNLLR